MIWPFNKKPSTRTQDIQTLESQIALQAAAQSTMLVANDITNVLRDRIDDYSKQIETISELLNDALIMVNDQGIIESFNRAAKDIFGYPKEIIMGEHISRIFRLAPKEDDFRPFMDRLLDDVNEFDPKLGYEQFKGLTSDGEEIYIDVSLSEMYKKDGQKTYLVLIRDVSSRVLDQREIQEQEQHFRAFGEASQDGMIIHDATRILDWNQRFLDMTGYRAEDLSGLDPLSFIHPRVRHEAEVIDNALFETLMVTKDLNVLEIECISKPIVYEDKQARIKLMHDISEYKHMENLLRSSKERYQTVIDNTIDLVCCYNTEYEITFINHTFGEYFGIPSEKLLGANLLAFIPPDDHESFKQAVALLSPDYPVRRCLHRININGEIRWQDWIDRAIFDDKGALVEFQSVSRDITHYVKTFSGE